MLQRRQSWPLSVFLAIVSCLLCGTTASAASLRATVSKDSLQLQHLLNEFPSYQDTFEMAGLSGLVYSFLGHDACNATDADGTPLLPPNLDCHLYHHSTSQGTQVLVLTSHIRRYIAVVFAGTDDLRTTLADGNILLKPFGPLDENGNSILLPGPARVHAGFDNAVFVDGLFDNLLNLVQDLNSKHPEYRLFTTGHSLGAADAILTAVAFAHHMPSLHIRSFNFGCPRTGNRHWRDAVQETYDNVAIWRFVHGWDLVPRLPEYPFEHVGHTVQMDPNGMSAYFLHRGNETLGYAGVPAGWSSKPFIWVPGALWSHHIRRYQTYLLNQSATDLDTYFVKEFVAIPEHNSTVMTDDSTDDYANPPDDVLNMEEAGLSIEANIW